MVPNLLLVREDGTRTCYKKLMRNKLLLENTTRARKVNKTKEHSASIDGYKHNIVLITATNNENLLSQKFVETTEGQLLM